MKRSEINQYIKEAEDFFGKNLFALPPFAGWSPQNFKTHSPETIKEILDCELGWDVTDYALDKYLEIGLLLVTIRNGIQGSTLYPKPYAEKIMLVKEDQVTPLHFHRFKTEDIINRAGGVLCFELFNSTPDEGLDTTPVTFWSDGVKCSIDAGKTLYLPTGSSITLVPRIYHKFYGKKGNGSVMVGEVSAVNDDHTDNVFYEKMPRYPVIEEDEAPYRLLVSDYKNLYQNEMRGI